MLKRQIDKVRKIPKGEINDTKKSEEIMKCFKKLVKYYRKNNKVPKNIKVKIDIIFVHFSQLFTGYINQSELDDFIEKAVKNLDDLKKDLYRLKEIYYEIDSNKEVINNEEKDLS